MALPESCPLCGADRHAQKVVTRHVYGDTEDARAFFHCTRCDVRYLFPGLTAEQEAGFYASEFEAFMAARAGAAGGWSKVEDQVRANQPTRLRRMQYLRAHLPPRGSVLEVGCSSGFMLLPLRADGHACVGVEPSGAFGGYLRSQGLETYGSLEELVAASPPRRFDLILHFFVLEHIAQPVAFLKRLLELLSPAGRIVFEVPNAADPLYSVYDIAAFERFYWSIAHPWYFSEPSLRYLLERTGQPFTIAREQRYDLSNHMVWARDGRPGGMGRFTALLGRELEDAYRRGLIAAGRCDTLVGILGRG
jgi:SAM-dependent methyltransferase